MEEIENGKLTITIYIFDSDDYFVVSFEVPYRKK